MEVKRAPLLTRRLLLFMGTMILANIAGYMYSPLLPLYLQELGANVGQVGLFFTLGAIAPLAFKIFKGERVGIVAGFFLIAVAIAVFLQSRVFAGFAVVWALFGIGEALIGPAYNALISKVVPLHLRGTAFGLVSTSIGLISLPAPYIGAVLWERFAPQVPFYVPLVATLLMLPVMWVKFKLPADESPQAN